MMAVSSTPSSGGGVTSTAVTSAPSCSSASEQHLTMSRTSMKSRVCAPSSNTTGGRLFSRREEKIAATPVYGLERACRSP